MKNTIIATLAQKAIELGFKVYTNKRKSDRIYPSDGNKIGCLTLNRHNRIDMSTVHKYNSAHGDGFATILNMPIDKISYDVLKVGLVGPLVDAKGIVKEYTLEEFEQRTSIQMWEN